jgi:MFS family permease
MLSLAVAMGIGRFAFTPLLPMMLHDGVVDLRTASWLASANYLGYLLGALLCTAQPWIWRRLGGLPPVRHTLAVRIGLSATCALTLGMALHLPAAWPLLRFLAGVASALVFVFASGWCMGQLARLGVPARGALIFVGPGAGIMLSGVAASAMVADGWRAATGWLAFGVLAAVLTAAIWRVFARQHVLPISAPASVASSAEPTGERTHGATELGLLTLAYGLAGFGYIITATFLPVIARGTLPNSAWLDLFWPIFGLGVMLGAVIASRIRNPGDMRIMLAGCYVIQALGVAAGLVSPTSAGFAIGSLLLGLPFTAITYFAMQEVRRVRPLAVSAFTGLLTAMYGFGQVAGPPLAAFAIAHSASATQGFDLSLGIAAASLVLGALIYGWMARAYPYPRGH